MFDKIGETIFEAFRTLLLTISEALFKAIAFCYEVFEVIGSAQILTNDVVQEIYRKVGLILAIFMIFRIIISLVQILVDPDSISDKQKGVGNIIKKVLVVIVLLGVTPSIFNYAYKLQNMIINPDNNIIAKVILPAGDDSDTSDFGVNLAWNIFSAFYVPVDFNAIENGDTNFTLTEDAVDCVAMRRTQNGIYESIMERSFKEDSSISMGYAYQCLNRKVAATEDVDGEEQETSVYAINFEGLFMVVVSLVVLYVIVVYTIGVAQRLFQLAFLQLIAPIPIMGYLGSSKDNIFGKWVKMCVTTYLDFFIRTAIIYFVVMISDLLLHNGSELLEQSLILLTEGQRTYAIIILIVALLLFALRITNLVSELFPKGGAASIGYGLGIKKNIIEPIKKSAPIVAAGAVGGYVARKGIGFVDRKIHNTPKPRNKFQQWVDKNAPGYAQAHKDREQATLMENENRRKYARGERLYRSHGENLSAAFSSEAYRRSYEGVKTAKDAEKSAKSKMISSERTLDLARVNLSEAYNSNKYNIEQAGASLSVAREALSRIKQTGSEDEIKYAENMVRQAEERLNAENAIRQQAIDSAQAQYEQAFDTHKTDTSNFEKASSDLEKAKKKHDDNKKIYIKDAKLEEDYDYYEKNKG